MLNKPASRFIPGAQDSILAPCFGPRLTATVYFCVMNRLTPLCLRVLLLRWLLPATLLLAQHGVWAHGFTHDLGKITGQTQNDARHDCCLPFQAAGDAACAALPVYDVAPAAAKAFIALPASRESQTLLPYASRAPPSLS